MVDCKSICLRLGDTVVVSRHPLFCSAWSDVVLEVRVIMDCKGICLRLDNTITISKKLLLYNTKSFVSKNYE